MIDIEADLAVREAQQIAWSALQRLAVSPLRLIMWLLIAVGSPAPGATSGSSAGPLTVDASIEVRRVLHLFVRHDSELQISPDGKRYLMILVQGDLARDGNWIEFISGKTSTLAEASPKLAVRLLTLSKRVNPLVDRQVVWLKDRESVAFLWDDGQHPSYVMKLNLRTGATTTLMRHKSDITNFSLSADERSIVFSASSNRLGALSERMLRTGFAVPEQVTLLDILSGAVAGNPIYYPDVFLGRAGGAPSRRVSLPDSGVWLTPVFLQVGLHEAPNGRYAVVTAPPQAVPEAWSSYSDPTMVAVSNAMRTAPKEPASRIEQYWLVDNRTAEARPLWNAPTYFSQDDVSWSPNSRWIAIAPTFMPIDDSMSSAARSGKAVAIFAVDTGGYSELRLPAGVAPQHKPARWSSIGAAEVEVAAHRDGDASGSIRWLRFTMQRDGHWRFSSEADDKGEPISEGVRLELRQDLNSPPTLYGVDSRSGESRKLFEVNPGLLKRYRLGQVSFVHWQTKDGKRWTGKLYYPVNYSADAQFPLVIKCGFYDRSDSFSLSGDDDNMTIGGAEAMAGRDIAILLVGKPDGGIPPGDTGTPREFEANISAYESAIEYLAKTGLANSSRIGILGVSRCGDQVAHFITQSSYPIAAAELADNLDDSYLQYLMTGVQVRAAIAGDIGAEPIGDGLEVWRRVSPGFNIDRIRAPVRFERDSGGIVSAVASWEMFSRLRELRRPAELYFIPDISRGDHQLTSPSQLLASQGGTVDWFDFWLNGHEDPDAKKTEQYSRWRELRALRDVP